MYHKCDAVICVGDGVKIIVIL